MTLDSEIGSLNSHHSYRVTLLHEPRPVYLMSLGYFHTPGEILIQGVPIVNTESLRPSSCFRSPFSKGQSLKKVDEVRMLLLQVWIEGFSGESGHDSK